MRRIPLWPAVIIAGTIAVLGLFLLIVLRNVEEMRIIRDESFRIEHTLEVQRQLDAVLMAESEADAGVRGYLLTGAPQALDNLRASQRSVAERLDRLEALTADNPVQRERLVKLREAVALRVELLDRVIDVRRTGTIDAAMEQARAADTNTVRDQIRGIISDLEAEEAALLAARREQASGSYERAVRGRVGSGIVSAALLIAIVVTAGLHARSKAQREAALVESERRAREAAAREQEARAEAERANREKDQFLAVLSHELRTPLNAVLGWTQILQAAGPTEPTIVRALASIRRNAEAQQRLVEDLLDVSRIVSGKLPFEREPVDLRSAIGAAVESIRPSAQAKGLTVVTELDAVAPAVGDPQRIQQVAANLLSNAVKFTPSGGHVSVTLRNGGADAVLEVEDNGQGIPADLQPHIFERFRQGDGSTTRAHGGLGLGLAIAKHIVEAHGGTITVYSSGENQGARFRVQLPYG
jgi:signal transduction histidine kinase